MSIFLKNKNAIYLLVSRDTAVNFFILTIFGTLQHKSFSCILGQLSSCSGSHSCLLPSLFGLSFSLNLCPSHPLCRIYAAHSLWQELNSIELASRVHPQRSGPWSYSSLYFSLCIFKHFLSYSESWILALSPSLIASQNNIAPFTCSLLFCFSASAPLSIWCCHNLFRHLGDPPGKRCWEEGYVSSQGVLDPGLGLSYASRSCLLMTTRCAVIPWALISLIFDSCGICNHVLLQSDHASPSSSDRPVSAHVPVVLACWKE